MGLIIRAERDSGEFTVRGLLTSHHCYRQYTTQYAAFFLFATNVGRQVYSLWREVELMETGYARESEQIIGSAVVSIPRSQYHVPTRGSDISMELYSRAILYCIVYGDDSAGGLLRELYWRTVETLTHLETSRSGDRS